MTEPYRRSMETRKRFCISSAKLKDNITAAVDIVFKQVKEDYYGLLDSRGCEWHSVNAIKRHPTKVRDVIRNYK